jgi:hypothetical protein
MRKYDTRRDMLMRYNNSRKKYEIRNKRKGGNN